jgi:hypothetical protein
MSLSVYQFMCISKSLRFNYRHHPPRSNDRGGSEMIQAVGVAAPEVVGADG